MPFIGKPSDKKQIGGCLGLGAGILTAKKHKKYFSDGNFYLLIVVVITIRETVLHRPLALLHVMLSEQRLQGPDQLLLNLGHSTVDNLERWGIIFLWTKEQACLLLSIKAVNSSSSIFFSCNTNPLREHPSWPYGVTSGGLEGKGNLCKYADSHAICCVMNNIFLPLTQESPGFCQHPVITTMG